jgi:transcription-repair coupling factor (superfamily II helicase)
MSKLSSVTVRNERPLGNELPSRRAAPPFPAHVKAGAPNLLDAIGREPSLAAKLRAVGSGGDAIVFEQVAEGAHSVLCAAITQNAQPTRRRVWLVCPALRAQELLHNELLQWAPDALFFPELEVAPVEGAIPDPETVAERLAIIHRLNARDDGERPPVIVLTKAALDEAVPDAEQMQSLEVRLARGETVMREMLLGRLSTAGYEQTAQVSQRGQFAVRGGILDVFSFHHSLPTRLEFFGDELESIRQFDLDAQTSVEQLPSCTILLGQAEPRERRLRDCIREGDITVDVGAEWPEAKVTISCGSVGAHFAAEDTDEVTADEADDLTTDDTDGTDGRSDAESRSPIENESPHSPKRRKADSSSVPSVSSVVSPSASSAVVPSEASVSGGAFDYSLAFFDNGLGEFEAGDFVVDEARRERFFAQLTEWRTQGWSTFVFCNNEGEIERLHDLIPAVEADALHFSTGTLGRGFTFPAGRVAVLSDSELFGRYRNTRARRLALKRSREIVSRSQIDFSELIEGELVVHLEHGIARFEALKQLPNGEDVLVLEFAEGAKLYVPLDQSYLVARYVGIGKKHPPLSKLGDAAWTNAKKKAEKAAFDYAGKLLETHAARETQKGFAFPPDSKWGREFEASFLYKETPDQLTAIADTKTDMETEQPMDRLICGDVGFGKTEVAIRAAFKAVCAGKQVAVLVPTTVLAEQHLRTFRERMSDYPVTVDMLSRFRTRGQQTRTLRGVREGSVDIVIGTHRLISKDVEFKDLGLVVIDEEQRFGVLHKERFKQMWPLVDLLTLSATPIPRTLYLSLMGAKDMSTIETAPLNRIPVETLICPYDERIIRDAIQREMKRQGQVFFLHNRVGDIQSVEAKIRMLVPSARTLVGHGQMDEHELEEVMHQFVSGDADVLISTTIIESGVDIPNANTIIIDRADRFGLADLYQLRGRVGRAQHKAYAYLMLPRDMLGTGEARRRINAIKQYGSLGAGFKIAMRDLEIRGAGNILGTAQSGHIVTIGFELYCAMLRQAIAKLKGERRKARTEVALHLDFAVLREPGFAEKERKAGWAPAFLPTGYIGETQARIAAYRHLNELNTQEALDKLRKDWRDRFGRFPDAVENLLTLAELRISSAARKITGVEVKEDKLMLTRGGDFILIGGKFPRLAAKGGTARLRETLKMIRSL